MSKRTGTRRTRTIVTIALALLAATGDGSAGAAPGTSATLPGTPCPVLPANSIWHADVSALPVAPRSAEWLSHMSASTRRLHPDFGPSYGAQPVPYGIPITRVAGTHAKVPVRFTYASESDQVLYRWGPTRWSKAGQTRPATGTR